MTLEEPSANSPIGPSRGVAHKGGPMSPVNDLRWIERGGCHAVDPVTSGGGAAFWGTRSAAMYFAGQGDGVDFASLSCINELES